jgi:hypothetical protein
MEFRYSWAHDQENRLRFTDPLYPSGGTIREYMARVSDEWKPKKRRILSRLSSSSGLPWQESMIICYLTGRGVPLSDPLSIPVYEGHTETFIERLTHALCQRLVMHPRNLEHRSAFWESMFRSLSEDGVKVSYMVPVNALFQDIRARYLGAGTLAEGESLVTRNLDYRRAWEIVNNIGPEDIIKRLRRGRWD